MECVFDREKFDEFAETACGQFYAEGNGRPSLPPGTYFRLLLIGYFEGIDSERGIAWRVADSLGLRQFLRIGLDEDNGGIKILNVAQGSNVQNRRHLCY